MRLGFGPQNWNLGLETGIWASGLEFGPRDWDLRGMEEEEEEEEKIPSMCETESIDLFGSAALLSLRTTITTI